MTEISNTNILFFLSLSSLCGMLCFVLSKDLAKQILFAALRSLLQLIALGYVLKILLDTKSNGLNITVALVMTCAAIMTIYSRLKRKDGFTLFSLFPSLCLSAWPVCIVFLFIINPDHLFEGRIFIPLIGMILGNTLNGISLGVERVQVEVEEKHNLIQTLIGLGASWFEATKLIYISALKTALTPILNTMFVVGIVSLPGLMTGQILAGKDSMISARYQYSILSCIFVTLFIGSNVGIFLQIRRLFINKVFIRGS